MKIKIINHLQGTSKGSISSSSRRTTTASADRQRTNNIAHTPRCVPRWDSDSTRRDATRLVARSVAGIVSEICLVLLQAPCTVDAYAVNESSRDESSRVRAAAVTVNDDASTPATQVRCSVL